MMLETSSDEQTADFTPNGPVFRVPVTVAALPGQEAQFGVEIEELARWCDFRIARIALERAGAVAHAEQDAPMFGEILLQLHLVPKRVDRVATIDIFAEEARAGDLAQLDRQASGRL